MTKYSNRVVTYTVQIIKGSDNQDSYYQDPTILPNKLLIQMLYFSAYVF